jgi:outer membrane protein assembly factor BamD
MRGKVLLVLVILGLLSCKSQFETIRTSNNPERIYKSANEFYVAKEYDKSIALYDLVIQHYRGRQEAEELFFKYAYAHYHINDFILASTYFKNYTSTFSNSIHKEEAEYMSAYANYRLSPNSKLDQTYTEKAIEGFEQFINLYPTSNRVTECNKLIDQLRAKQEVKAYDQGYLYYKIGEYQSAVTSFEIMENEYPDSKRIEEVRFLILKSSFTLAVNSITEKKKERFNETLSKYERFIKKHPKSKWSKDAKSIH